MTCHPRVFKDAPCGLKTTSGSVARVINGRIADVKIIATELDRNKNCNLSMCRKQNAVSPLFDVCTAAQLSSNFHIRYDLVKIDSIFHRSFKCFWPSHGGRCSRCIISWDCVSPCPDAAPARASAVGNRITIMFRVINFWAARTYAWCTRTQWQQYD